MSTNGPTYRHWCNRAQAAADEHGYAWLYLNIDNDPEWQTYKITFSEDMNDRPVDDRVVIRDFYGEAPVPLNGWELQDRVDRLEIELENLKSRLADNI